MGARWLALLSPAATLLLATVTVAGEKPVSVGIGNSGPKGRKPGPITFGMVFPPGRMPGSVKDRDRDTQADVKRRWPDGSVKHAVLTVEMKEMPAGGKRLLRLVSRAPEGASGTSGSAVLAELPESFGDVVLRLSIHKGPELRAGLRRAMKAGTLRTWLAGPQVVEKHYRTAPVDDKGASDTSLVVRFRVRYYPRAGAARVAVVVENCNWKSPGNIPYDVKITVAGQERFALKEVGRWAKGRDKRLEGYIGHARGARWVKRFWLGRDPGEVFVHRTLRYLNETGLLPRYDFNLRIPDGAIAGSYAKWRKAPRAPLQNGWLAPRPGAAGERAEIGPLPSWTVACLMKPDPRTLEWVFGHGDIAGACPVHLRDERTDWVISLDDHPEYCCVPRGRRPKAEPREAAAPPWVLPARSHFSADAAQRGSLACVPYIFTGDYFYLEELQFRANHNMISLDCERRGKAKGLLAAHQMRGAAWALRNLVHAAALSPDGSRGRKYFEAKLAGNLACFDEFLAGKLKRKPTPIGTYTPGAAHEATSGWPGEVRKRYFSIAGRQHNYLAWALSHTAVQGYAQARPMRDYLMKWTIGLATSAKEIPPGASCAEHLFVGERSADGNRFCRTWKEVAELTWNRPGGVPAARAPGPKTACRGESGAACRGVILEAERGCRPNASRALEWVDRNWRGRLPLQWRFEPIGE